MGEVVEELGVEICAKRQAHKMTYTHKCTHENWGRAGQTGLRMDLAGHCARWLTEETGVCAPVFVCV